MAELGPQGTHAGYRPIALIQFEIQCSSSYECRGQFQIINYNADPTADAMHLQVHMQIVNVIDLQIARGSSRQASENQVITSNVNL